MTRKRNLPHGWGLPLAALTAAALGHAEAPAKLLVAYCGMSVATLALPDALRQGCAELISKRKVLGSALTALLITLLCTAAALIGLGYLTKPLDESAWWILTASAAIAANCLIEILAAQGSTVRKLLADAANAALLALPMSGIAFGENAAEGCFMSACCGLAFSMILVGSLNWRCWPQASFRFLKHIPTALVRVMLLPAMVIALILFRAGFGRMSTVPLEIAAIAAGVLAVTLTKSTFRRSREESAGLLAGMTLFAAAAGTAGLLAAYIPEAAAHSALAELPWTLVLSAGCALALYAGGGLRTVAAIALLMLAPFVPTLWSFVPAVKAALAVIAALLMIPEWRSIFRGVRAGRIRRKARRA